MTTITPRYYQREPIDLTIQHVKKSLEPCLIELPTGAGKSVVIAFLAKELHEMTGKNILCLVPSKELLEQNAEKIALVNDKVSLFSASVGEKCLRHPLVVGTEKTVKNQIHRFGSKFCAVIIDEAHKTTPTIKEIITAMQAKNPQLRVIGLSATPYRLGSGYIYEIDETGKKLPEEKAREPYYKRLLYRLEACELIEQGFLTRPTIGKINEHYDAINLELNKSGNFNSKEIDRAFNGQGRLTASIIADIVERSKDRKGVMIFAATVQHAQECLESLPPQLSAIVTGETPSNELKLILLRFKAKKIKYIVNVAVLTTGFDVPHVDVVAILRATESVALLQQIIGRGLRIAENKADCLILDYAENIQRHCPDGDVFNPDIKASLQDSEKFTVKAQCPVCDMVNEFAGMPNKEGLNIDRHGYFVDLLGQRIETEYGDMPAHYGRRCQFYRVEKGVSTQCGYRWTFKPCSNCDAENDIAARYCSTCHFELIDPNEKLKLEHAQIRDAKILQTENVISLTTNEVISKAGNECLRVKFTTPTRSFMVWFNQATEKQTRLHNEFIDAKNSDIKTITYKKENEFFKIYAYNKEVGL